MKFSPDRRNLFSILIISFRCLVLTLTAAFLTVAQSHQDAAAAIESYNQGVMLVAKNENEKALEKFTEAIRLDPELAQAFVNRAAILLASGRDAGAGEDIDKAIAIFTRTGGSPKLFAIAYQLKAMVLKQQKKTQAALEYFAKSIGSDPRDAKTYINRATLYLEAAQYDDALADLNKAEEIDPTVMQVYLNRAIVYRHRNNHVAALKDIEQAILLDASSDLAYYNRGNILSSLNRNEEAAADFNKAISLAKRPQPQHFHALSLTYYRLGKHELSLSTVNEAVKLDPNFVFGYQARAFAHYNLGKLNLAIEDAKKVVSLKPASPNARYNLAYFLIRGKQYALAAAEATKAIELAPEWRTPYILRGRAFAMLGKAALARSDQETARKLPATGRPKEQDPIFVSMDIDLAEDF